MTPTDAGADRVSDILCAMMVLAIVVSLAVLAYLAMVPPEPGPVGWPYTAPGGGL